MSYATELAKINRKKITKIEIELDYCNNTYGVAPCNPITGSDHCYNTYRTCVDNGNDIFLIPPKGNFDKITKIYKFTTAGITPPFYGCRPYLRSYQLLPQEIKDNITVKNRITVELYDDYNESDIDNDPYWTTRGYTSTEIPGSYFKRLFARNPNFKYRPLRIYEGFEGNLESEFILRFTGKIDNIQFNNGIVKIDCIDNFKFLDTSNISTKLSGQLAVDITNTQTTGISVTSTSGLASSGTILIDNEIIHYQSLSGNTLVTVTRGYYGTLATSHQKGAQLTLAKIYYGNPFNIMKTLLTEAGITYVAAMFDEITGNSIYSGEPYCVAIIISDTKRSDLFWELVDQLGCKVWLDEYGYLNIRRNIFYATWGLLPDYITTQVTINDDENILKNSASIDWAESTRYTTIYFYYNLKIHTAKRALSSNIDSSVTTIGVTSVADLPAQGEVLIGTEFILYTSLNTSLSQLTGCTRGNRGSTAAAHSSGDAVYQGDVSSLKDIKKSDSFSNLAITVHDDAVTEYGQQEVKTIYSRFFNSFAQYSPTGYTVSGYSTYITNLTTKLINSLKDAKNKFSFELEIKDEGLNLGDFHKVSTDDFNEITGNNFVEKQFQVIKKEISEGGKIKYTSEKVISYD